jgi:hypothetical protein
MAQDKQSGPKLANRASLKSLDGGWAMIHNIQHSTFNIQRSTLNAQTKRASDLADLRASKA